MSSLSLWQAFKISHRKNKVKGGKWGQFLLQWKDLLLSLEAASRAGPWISLGNDSLSVSYVTYLVTFQKEHR